MTSTPKDPQVPHDETLCPWATSNPLLTHYHNQEWGRPVFNDQKLFECLMLEAMQSGLSWLTVLRKREGYRLQFANFDVSQLAQWGEAEIQSALENPNIIRHRAKIEAILHNAHQIQLAFPKTQQFSQCLWQYAPQQAYSYQHMDELPNQTSESIAMSKKLKSLGLKFVGPITCYSFMQAVGMVNNHLKSCSYHNITERAQMLRRENQK